MLVAIQGYTPEEAVYHVRTNYCDQAIETYEQCEYLQQIDEYYNNRVPVEENLPIPSIVFQIQQMESEKEKDKYEGFNGVKS